MRSLLIMGLTLVSGILLGSSGFMLFRSLAAFDSTATSSYLDLQAASDTVHRIAIVSLPTCLLIMLLGLILWRFGSGRTKALSKWLVGSAVLVCAFTSSFIISFDLDLEHLGLIGQLEESVDWKTSRTHLEQHPARHDQSGTASFSIGPGGEFDDDILVSAVQISDRSPMWSLHLLGRGASKIIVAGDHLAFTVWRPSGLSDHLVNWVTPAERWSTRLDSQGVLAPRQTSTGMEVALVGHLVILDASTHQPLSIASACQDPKRWKVACQDGRVIAWSRGGIR